MVNRKSIFVILILIIPIISIIWTKHFNHFEINDVYYNKLIFSKYDSLPLSGKLVDKDSNGKIIAQFKNGLPIGIIKELNINGDVNFKGEFIDNIISTKTKKYIGIDPFAICIWDNYDWKYTPNHLTLTIYKNQNFFSSNSENINLKEIKSHTELLSNCIFQDTKTLKYKFLTVEYNNCVYNFSNSFKFHFKINNNESIYDTMSIYNKNTAISK